MVKGIGIDIEPIERLETMLVRYDRETLRLIFTPGELDRQEKANAPALYLALCFSAKEAVSKALGTGFSTIDWNEIESEVIGEQKQMRITLSGKALRQAQSLAATNWVASWASWEGLVVVTVVVE
jgi:holo-[acyl-carrier protein] synthase